LPECFTNISILSGFFSLTPCFQRGGGVWWKGVRARRTPKSGS
jgi:hypothetical protein